MSQNASSPTSVMTPSAARAADMPLRIVRSIDDLQYRVSIYQNLYDCAVAWRLFEQTAIATAFQQHAWLSAWMATVGKARQVEPRIVLVRDPDGELVMILPFAIERAMGVSTLVWLAQDEADYHGPLIHPKWNSQTPRKELGRILNVVASSIPSADAFSLTKTLAEIDGVKNPLGLLPHVAHPSSGHAISLDHDDFEVFYASLRSKSTRKRDRQRRRRLDESGDVAFTIPTTRADQHAMLDAILQQKSVWLNERGITDPFGSDEVKAFLHGLIDDHTARSSLHLSALTLDGDVIAGNVGFVRGDRFYAVIGSVTEGEASRHSPGTIHLHELLRWCFANNISAFDLTVGDEGYKKDWCDAHQDLIDIRISLTLAGYVFALPSRIKDTLKRRIKASPALFDLALSARRIVRSVIPA